MVTNSQVKSICGADGISPCTIGSRGPAGGIVFLTPTSSGNTTGLFYEAAPAGWNGTPADPEVEWCDITSTQIGTLVPFGREINGADKSAIMVGDCSAGAAIRSDIYSRVERGVTYADWFLPSIGELHAMWDRRALIGGFSEILYWSSSEFSAMEAHVLTFDVNEEGGANAKSESHAVRPVRAF